MVNHDTGNAVRSERAAISNPVLRATMVRATDELRRIVSRLLADVDEVLFDLAETSPSNTTQRRYFDGMREIRRQSRSLVERFCIELECGFIALAQSAPLAADSDSSARPADPPSARLLRLRQRLGVLVGKSDIAANADPLEPPYIAHCLHTACREGSLDDSTVEVVDGLAAERLYGRLEPLYSTLNEFLAERQVLPHLGAEELVPANDDDAALSTSAAGPCRDTLVAGLFGYFARDDNLPPPIRDLLARLQEPFSQIATADSTAFTDRGHPARRLINHLARVGLKWSPEVDRDKTIYNELAAAVDRLAGMANATADGFESVLDELVRCEQQREQQAAVAERKATEATRGRERLLSARQAATHVVSAALADQQASEVVAGLLRSAWINVLLLTHLRHGEGSSEWQDAVGMVGDLIWTGQPKRSAADVARLQSMLPALSQRLRLGLEMVAFQIDDIQGVFEELSTLYRSLLSPEYQDRLHMPSARAAMPLRPVTHLRPVALPAMEIPAQAPKEKPAAAPANPPSELIQQQVEGLRIGTWFQFKGADGAQIRAKLSWRSPISKKLLFVTANGTKLADKSSDELATEIAAGEAVMLDSAPIFERAMGSVLGKSGSTPAPPGAD